MRARAALATVSVLAGVTACGGGGGEGGAALSSRALTDAIEELCEEALDDIDDLDTPRTIGEWDDFGSDAAVIITTFADGLRALAPPARLRDELDELIENLDEQAAASEELAAAGRDGDEDAIADISAELRSLNAEMEPLALRLDASACARSDAAVPDTTTTAPPTTTPSTTTTVAGSTTTDGSTTDSAVRELDLATVFTAPEGYQLEAFTDGVGDIIASFRENSPALEAGLESYGGATVLASDGTFVGTLFMMLANDTVPDLAGTDVAEQWFALAYGSGFDSEEAYTTADGVPGTLYTFEDGTVAFTAVDGQVGLTFYTDTAADVDPFVDGLLDANLSG